MADKKEEVRSYDLREYSRRSTPTAPLDAEGKWYPDLMKVSALVRIADALERLTGTTQRDLLKMRQNLTYDRQMIRDLKAEVKELKAALEAQGTA